MSLTLSQSSKITGLLVNFSQLLIASQAKISAVIAILFLIGASWLSGELAWSLLGDTSALTKWRAVSASGSQTRQSAGQDISPLLNAHLFGVYSEKAASKPVAPVVKDAPKTRLNLVLVGVVSSSDPEAGLAIIANRGSQATYGVGETIEGTRAKLKSVLVDRVIIDNAGRDETLMLEGVKYQRLDESSTKTPTKKKVSNASVRGGNNPPQISGDELEKIREIIAEDPQKIMQYIRMSQAKEDGKIVGYRVSPGKNKVLFNSVGLKNGDVATHLNGEDLTDPAAMGRIWKSVSDLTELNLTVERDGQPYEIYIAF